jgi:hypothetical protein
MGRGGQENGRTETGEDLVVGGSTAADTRHIHSLMRLSFGDIGRAREGIDEDEERGGRRTDRGSSSQ